MNPRYRAAAVFASVLYLASCGGNAASPSPSQQPGQVRAISTSNTPTPAISASASGSASPSPTAATATPETVKIGLMAPFTGPAAAFGQDMLKGAQMAVDEVNASASRHFVIDQGDDKASPTSAPATAQRLISDGIVAVVGPATSGSALAAEATFNQAKVPMVTPSANDPRITDQHLTFVFRAAGRWDQEPPLLAEYIFQHHLKVALLADQSSYGQMLAAGMRQALAKSGARPLADETFDRGARDFATFIAKVKPEQPGAIFYGGYAAEAGSLAKALTTAGLKAVLIGGDAIEGQPFVAAAGAAADGAIVAFPPDAKRVPAAAKFLASYKQRYGTPASLYAISTYDSVRLVADAIGRAASTDGQAVRDALAADGAFDGVYWGKMSFDAKGDLQAPAYALWTVKAGKFEQLAS